MLTQEQLEALCREWQCVMRLQDWDVTVKVSRRWDMDGPNRSAECEYLLEDKTAAISILDPVDWVPSWLGVRDEEFDLVHELGHLIFAPFWDAADGTRKTEMESALNQYAKALLTLKRQGVIS